MIDYTKMRKGTRTRHGEIIMCPKCGNKGAYKPNSFMRGGERVPLHQVIHTGEIVDPFFITRRYCWLSEAPGEPAPATASKEEHDQ
jgi:hypothetical protein